MKKDTILSNITIEKLIFGGKWLARTAEGKKILISGGAIPESIVDIRVIRSKSSFIEGQIVKIVKKSPLEEEVAPGIQVYGWCKWLPIKYENQLKIKEWQVREAFHHIRDKVEGAIFHPIVASPEKFAYRNKVEFSWGKYISDREWVRDEFRFGFHEQGTFDRIINCESCVLADTEINEIFHEVDTFSRSTDLPTYDPKRSEGFWRHLVIRKGSFSGEIMLIFSVNSNHEDYPAGKRLIKDFIQNLVKKYPNIVSACILENFGKADIVTGEVINIFGKPTITEKLLGLEFDINPKSFFQTNSYGAELLYKKALEYALSGNEKDKWVLLDLYAGTGTIGMLMAREFERVYSVELVTEASKDGERNALKNGITNMKFVNEKVEDFVKVFLESGKKTDVIMVDPPRDGMHPSAPESILAFNANIIVYVSCNPATLVRDLGLLLATDKYRVTDITPVDMFPHTNHIETVVRLEKKIS